METKKKKIGPQEDCYLEGKAILRDAIVSRAVSNIFSTHIGRIILLQSTQALCFLSMASAFLGNVPNSWHLQTGLHFTFEFYAPQVLTEGSSDSVTGCLAFQDFLWSLSVFSKISFSGIFPHKKSPHHAFKVCQTGAFRIKITLALEY